MTVQDTHSSALAQPVYIAKAQVLAAVQLYRPGLWLRPAGGERTLKAPKRLVHVPP